MIVVKKRAVTQNGKWTSIDSIELEPVLLFSKSHIERLTIVKEEPCVPAGSGMCDYVGVAYTPYFLSANIILF